MCTVGKAAGCVHLFVSLSVCTCGMLAFDLGLHLKVNINNAFHGRNNFVSLGIKNVVFSTTFKNHVAFNKCIKNVISMYKCMYVLCVHM